jgi:hypothetical protein
MRREALLRAGVRWWLPLAVALAVLATAVPGLAAKSTSAQLTDAISKHRLTLVDIKRADVDRVADREIAKMEDWLSQAQVDVAASKLAQARKMLIRIDAQAMMIRELVKMSNLERQADEAKKALAAAEEALQKAQAGLKAAEEKKRELEAKGY